MSNICIEKLDYKCIDHQLIVFSDLYKFMIDFYKKYYPKFENWYFRKVFSEFVKNERTIYLVKNESNLYGVSIIRKSEDNYRNNKICSFFLLPEIRNNGIGKQLILKSKEEFSNIHNKPILITVPEERMFEKISGKSFYDFLKDNEFFLSNKRVGRYRPSKYEYILFSKIVNYKKLNSKIKKTNLIQKI